MDVYFVHVDNETHPFKTYEDAEAFRVKIAEARSEGQGKEGFCQSYDEIEIEKIIASVPLIHKKLDGDLMDGVNFLL